MAFRRRLIPGRWRDLFCGHLYPASAHYSAAHATLQHLKDAGGALQETLNAKTAELAARLNRFFEVHEAPTRIEHFGSMFYYSFPPDLRMAPLHYHLMRERGIHLIEGYPCFLTTAHSAKDFERVAEAFEQTTLEMQKASFLPASSSHATRIVSPPIAPASRSGPQVCPLTDPQVEILLSIQLNPSVTCAYNESLKISFKGALDVPALQRSLQQVTERHDILNGTFNSRKLLLVVSPPRKIGIPIVDLSSQKAAAREKQLQELIAHEATTPFDLALGPVVRARLVRLAADEHVLLLCTHHLVCDGWSANVIMSELAAIYSAEHKGAVTPLPKAFQFVEYAARRSAYQSTPEYLADENYWLSLFQKKRRC